MELDADGQSEIISGSATGHVYLFDRNSDGSFRSGEPIEDRWGWEINVRNLDAVFAADWDSDGDLDLLMGTMNAGVLCARNEGTAAKYAFGKPVRLKAAGKPINLSDAAPIVTDWDQDGLVDLLVGTGNGSVVWFRNIGTRTKPELAAAVTIIRKSSPSSEGGWGNCVKPCVHDWNGDGRPDLLLGSESSYFGKPDQTEEERAAESAAQAKLAKLMESWSRTFEEYRRLIGSPENNSGTTGEAREEQLNSLRENLRRYKEEIAGMQKMLQRYEPQYLHHGFVWLFLRKPRLERLK